MFSFFLSNWILNGYFIPVLRGRTFPANFPLAQLDWIMVRKKDANYFSILETESLKGEGNLFSDHLPVSTTLIFENKID